MHIGIWCTTHRSIPPKGYGGVQLVNWVTAEALVEADHKVTLFANNNSKTSADLVVMPSGSGELHEEHLAKSYEKEIRECDILIDTSTFSYPGRIFSLKGIPYIIRTGGDCNKRYCQHWNRNIVFPSQDQLNHHNNGKCHCSAKRNKLNSRTPPILRKPVCYWIHSRSIQNFDQYCTYGNYPNKYYIYMGSIEPIKGVHLAIEFALRTDVQLIIVGPIKDKQYYDSKIKPFLKGKISYRPEVPSNTELKWKLLGAAKALVYPTNCHDADPNVPKESLLVKTPVIGLNNGALPEIVTDGKTGVICGSVDEMVYRYKELDKINPDLCRAEVTEKFSVETYRRNLIRILEDVIGGRSWH